MKVKSLKILVSLGAIGLAGYLAYFIYATMQTWEAVRQPLSRETQEKFLQPRKADETPRDDLVAYDDVKRGFIDLDWTGAPPPAVAAAPTEVEKPPERQKPDVAKLLTVLFIQVDTNALDQSVASVRYLDPQIRQTLTVAGDAPSAPFELRPEGKLPDPHGYARVARIEPTGVVFAFDEVAWGEQIVSPVTFELRIPIQAVGPAGPVVPSTTPLIRPAGQSVQFRPKYTVLVGENRYRLGSDDARKIAENYPEFLTRDVRYREWRDPLTGRKAGIQIDSVEAGSIVASHGAQSGDIIKSINGQPVSSVSEAISYVKNNADTTSVWEIVVSNKGKERTVVYESPPE